MGAVKNMFNAVTAWWRRERDWLTTGERDRQASLRQIVLKEEEDNEAGNVSELFYYFTLDEFSTFFEWKDGAYYIGNHRLANSFGADEIIRLHGLMTRPCFIKWNRETLNILITNGELSPFSVVMNTNVSMANAEETMENLSTQWLLKKKALVAKDKPDD